MAGPWCLSILPTYLHECKPDILTSKLRYPPYLQLSEMWQELTWLRSPHCATHISRFFLRETKLSRRNTWQWLQLRHNVSRKCKQIRCLLLPNFAPPLYIPMCHFQGLLCQDFPKYWKKQMWRTLGKCAWRLFLLNLDIEVLNIGAVGNETICVAYHSKLPLWPGGPPVFLMCLPGLYLREFCPARLLDHLTLCSGPWG